MPATLSYPGVYIEEPPSGVRTIVGVATPAMFSMTNNFTTSAATPAVVASGSTTLALWDYYDTVGAGHGVACRSLDAMGNASPAQTSITSLDSADVVTAAPLSNRYPRLAWLANVVGFALLLNVIRVAVMTSPLPFAWDVQPRLRLAAHLPYAFIIPLGVSAALDRRR